VLVLIQVGELVAGVVLRSTIRVPDSRSFTRVIRRYPGSTSVHCAVAVST